MYTLYWSPGTASLCVHWMLIELGEPHELVRRRREALDGGADLVGGADADVEELVVAVLVALGFGGDAGVDALQGERGAWKHRAAAVANGAEHDGGVELGVEGQAAYVCDC